MIKQDSLFALIKSMTKAEKRFFRIDTAKFQQAESKDYLRLFDAIAAQKVYDQKAIRDKFKNEPYFNQLYAVKKYLEHQILKSLRSFCSEESCEIKLNNY